MKKIFTFILTVFTAAFIFAAARPSLDGRAVVADEGEMPKGLFARTIGYLPGDSVTVTNPANGSTVDVLILGSIDSSEGVAILLSPEAANRLSIRKDSNVQVKITKRTGSLDENATGSAVLSDDGTENDYLTSELSEGNEETPAEAEETAPETESAEENTEAAEEVAETPAEAEETAPETESAEATVDEESVPVEAVETEEIPEEAVSADKFDEEAPAEPEAAVEETVPEAPAENAAEQVEETAPEVEEPVPEEKFSEDVPEIPADDSEIVNEEAPEVEEAAPSEMVDENAPEMAEETVEAPVEETAPEMEEAPVEEVPAEPENVEEPVEVEAPVENTVAEPVEEYAPIVLVPAEPNPPEETEAPEEAVEEVPAPAEEVVANTAVETPVEEAPAPVAEEKSKIEDFVKSEADLEKGKYYLQIAALGNTDNLNAIIEKYGTKYPVVLIPLANGRGYKVLVGPLTADEYGMITERFKAYGFKDCFLKKIK